MDRDPNEGAHVDRSVGRDRDAVDLDAHLRPVERGPDDIDPLLIRVARRLLSVHRPNIDDPGHCAHARCRQPYPCGLARLAAEAIGQAGGSCATGTELVGAAPGDGAP